MSTINQLNKLEARHDKYGLGIKMVLHLLQIQGTENCIITFLLSVTPSPTKKAVIHCIFNGTGCLCPYNWLTLVKWAGDGKQTISKNEHIKKSQLAAQLLRVNSVSLRITILFVSN